MLRCNVSDPVGQATLRLRAGSGRGLIGDDVLMIQCVKFKTNKPTREQRLLRMLYEYARGVTCNI
jgi:hypothetical protein